MNVKEREIAPDFELLDKDNKVHKLSDYRGEWVLLYFYPKDNTPGCTKQACDIRDNFLEFKKFNCVVIGISTDSIKSHKKFAEKYNLPFILLSDSEKKVVKNYGIWKKRKVMGIQYEGTERTSFLINPEGRIVKIYEKVNPIKHAQIVIDDLKKYAS
ncbi:MAG: thioredoxin-dependent thiol peroxidase [Patescibacteria group bacterium]|nr:thioredoxin-dependent thiol peroxidase [Patescibacteria group bacterium]